MGDPQLLRSDALTQSRHQPRSENILPKQTETGLQKQVLKSVSLCGPSIESNSLLSEQDPVKTG